MGEIMFEWITKERIRFGLRMLWSILMVITLFAGTHLLSIFAAMMLILMEIEDINESRTR
jgi:hypothetical protein